MRLSRIWRILLFHSPEALVPTAFLVLPNFHSCFYLTIRLWARDFYRMIDDEGVVLVNYHGIEIESEWSNCFSINLLVQNLVLILFTVTSESAKKCRNFVKKGALLRYSLLTNRLWVAWVYSSHESSSSHESGSSKVPNFFSSVFFSITLMMWEQ